MLTQGREDAKGRKEEENGQLLIVNGQLSIFDTVHHVQGVQGVHFCDMGWG